MTKTLTTEAMQEIYEAAVHEEATGDQDADFDLHVILDYEGGTGATIRKLIDMVRAANREAQPMSGECNREVYENGKSACLVAIPKETAEVICRGISEATGCKVDWHYIGGRVHIKALAPPAPAAHTVNCPFCGRRHLAVVNSQITSTPAVTGELLEAMDEVIRISDRDHEAWSRAKNAISACRAAMLNGGKS